ESNDNNTVEKDKEGSKEQKQKSEIEEFTEYSILDKKLDMDNLSDEVVKDNDYKRIILLKDENGQPQYKSIYIKNKNRLQVIDLNVRLVYNDKIYMIALLHWTHHYSAEVLLYLFLKI